MYQDTRKAVKYSLYVTFAFITEAYNMINRNMKTDSRLLALDIDGTLLTKEKKLTERTKSALSAAMKKGLTAVLVTGRPLSGLPEELLAFSDIRYVITSNGAITFDMHNRTAIRKALIDPLLAEQIARIHTKKNCCSMFL